MVDEEGYQKIKFMTKQKLLKAKEISKYKIEKVSSFLEGVQDLDVLAIKISVNSPVEVEDACLISDEAKLTEFAKDIESQR